MNESTLSPKNAQSCWHSHLKETTVSQRLESVTPFHCRAAFILSKLLASLLPCLLLSWPWLSQDQTMTQVLCLDCKESCLFPTFLAIAYKKQPVGRIQTPLKKKKKKRIFLRLLWVRGEETCVILHKDCAHKGQGLGVCCQKILEAAFLQFNPFFSYRTYFFNTFWMIPILQLCFLKVKV